MEAQSAAEQECSSSRDARSFQLSDRRQGCDYSRRHAHRVDQHEIQDGLYEHGPWRKCFRRRHTKQTVRQRDYVAGKKEIVGRDDGWLQMKLIRLAMFALALALALDALGVRGSAQAPTDTHPRKRLLVIGEEKGYRHESVSHSVATIERIGKESGLWDTTIRTDTEALTKKKLEYNAKNLNDFDAVLFYTGGDLEMNAQQKVDFISFIHDDGKGFIGVHSAAITFVDWPEYGDMIGGYYDEHPWLTFDAPIIVEDPSFPGMQQWPHAFVLRDEIYQMRNYSRSKVRVLMRLDVSKLDMKNKNVHRTDGDFAVTWAKMYGKGRVYYTTLGHVEENWDKPEFQQMITEAIAWAMGLENADIASRPLPRPDAGMAKP